MKKLFVLFMACTFYAVFQAPLFAQDTAASTVHLSFPLIDLPKNTAGPARYPSMQQAIAWSNDLYDLGYLGISKIGNLIFKPVKKTTPLKPALNSIFKYAASAAFVKYASELPVPLGIWSHEEFHRSALAAAGVRAKNGNWLFNRWDGSVYGVRDEDLQQMKQRNLPGLLYSYVAGVQSENYQTQINLLQDFYHPRTTYKNALYLYNAWYVWNYMRFSGSPATDSVKKGAAPYESKNPAERDFAGADLTAWAYDMFQPTRPYNSRDKFPEGEGVNRRVGYSELPAEAQQYLQKQKKLSLLNFVNPAILFVNRVRLSQTTGFNFFVQYAPTHFGNDIALYIPVNVSKNNYLFAFHRYSNAKKTFAGIEAALVDYPVSGRLEAGAKIALWSQPKAQDFYDEKGKTGGDICVDVKYKLSKNFMAGVAVEGKTKGWQIGNQFLESNMGLRAGFYYRLL